MPLSPFILLFLSLWAAACTPFGPAVFFHPPDASFEDRAIEESSGVVKSRRWEELFWTHNDSGHPPRLFAFDRRGRRIGAVDLLDAARGDFEDIAADDAGFLYLCDIGNNRNRRETFIVYKIPEVDPREVRQTKVAARFLFHYPDFRSPDAEACYFHEGNLYILTKEPGNGKTTLYRLDLSRPDRLASLAWVGETAVENSVTGADLSPDGRNLAVLTYTSIYLFFKPESGDNYLGLPSHHMPIRFGQAEAIAWDGGDLLITNEAGELLWLKTAPPNRPAPE